MGPRWKGKTAEAKANSEPMSQIISQLQSSLLGSNSQGLILGCSVRLSANPDQAQLLTQTCFGHPVTTIEKEMQWFQFSLEEAFYLCFVLKCINLIGENKTIKTDEEIRQYTTSQGSSFPVMFKAYSHLRLKNWVVRPGSQFGVDFVAYRHHPSLVHSEYAVIVKSDEYEDTNARLRVWSDFQCTLRLCGSVAKTLLVLYVEKRKGGSDGDGGGACQWSLEDYFVEERIVTRWIPEQSRESRSMIRKESFEPGN